MKHFVCLLPAVALALPGDAASLLKRHASFTDEQIAAVRRGERVVRMIDTGAQSEVAFAGAARLPVSLSTYLSRVRAGTLYKARDPILQIGRFAATPSINDLRALRFESYDLQAPEEDNKQWLLASVRQYEQNGTVVFGPLGERPAAVEFRSLAMRAGYLRERLPAAYNCLAEGRPAGADDLFLWKQITFGLRPVTRLAHVSVWEDTRGGRREAIVVTKQIYANRYFQVSYQIDHLISDESDPKHPAVYLITFNYGRSEFLEGISGKMLRPIVLSRTRAAAEKTLDQARRDFQLELL